MRDKRDVMRLHIKNGIRDLDKIRESYNSFGNGGFTQRTDAIQSYTPKVVMPIINDKIYNTPIRERNDFTGGIFSGIAAGGRRVDAYGDLGDLYRYYGGIPLKNNTLHYSKYKPKSSKDKNANYIAINDPDFRKEVMDDYNRVFNNEKLIKDQEFKINENTYSVSGYGANKKTAAIGKYFISKGSDENGDYISYYDVFDAGQPKEGANLGEKLGLAKPFEIYDRIYLDKNKK